MYSSWIVLGEQADALGRYIMVPNFSLEGNFVRRA